MKAKPFIKWAGGKTQLLGQFSKFYPIELKEGKIRKYIEPFLGSGAVFLDLAQKYSIESAYLTDINEELIIAYSVIQRDPHTLLEFLSKYSKQYKNLSEKDREIYYYDIRKSFNLQRFQINYKKYNENWVPRAAQFIFLNKTCYNGLFRVNKKGEFNVPFGKYKNPKIIDERNILSLHKILQIAEIFVGDFSDTEKYIDEKTFVYFDPPYLPISKTSSFTSYSKNGFDYIDQIRLAKYFSLLHNTKYAKLMLSNSDPTKENKENLFLQDVYNDFYIFKVKANRMINSNGKKRGPINELLITNYEVKEWQTFINVKK